MHYVLIEHVYRIDQFLSGDIDCTARDMKRHTILAQNIGFNFENYHLLGNRLSSFVHGFS